MRHPEDLLAGYVDGTLPRDERAVVDAHLSTCETCREEVALAARATAALASLPEEPVPFGLTGLVLAEARRVGERRPPVWARLQWAAGLAAAACLVLLAVVALPRLLGGATDEEEPATRAPTAEAGVDEEGLGGAAFGAPTLEVLDEDLNERDVRRLARESAKIAPLPSGSADTAFAAPDEAVSCLGASGATFDDRDVLVRLIEARYLGTPAYIGVFHEGPGGGEPPEQVVVWVASKAGCSILTLVSRAI
jgi:anti-sigma factor RsiW